MNNKTSLTAKELALYFGCEVSTMHRGTGTLVSVGFHSCEVSFGDGWGSVPEPWPDALIMPILRPLSDMTNEEYIEHRRLMVNPTPVHSHLLSDGPESFRYLLSRNFDLFGWIEAGLAVDKTKIEKP